MIDELPGLFNGGLFAGFESWGEDGGGEGAFGGEDLEAALVDAVKGDRVVKNLGLEDCEVTTEACGPTPANEGDGHDDKADEEEG